MEEYKTMQDDTVQEQELIINLAMRRSLTETYKWARFFAILLGICVGILFLASLCLPFMNASEIPDSKPVLFITYVLCALLYLPPVIFLHKFSKNMKAAFKMNDTVSLEFAFEKLKSLFKYMGIITIISLSCFFFMILYSLILTSTGTFLK